MVAELLVKGFTPDQVMQGLQVRNIPCGSRNQVLADIRAVRAEWRKNRLTTMEHRASQELQVLEMIRGKALDAWEESRRGTTTTERNEESEEAPAAFGVPAGIPESESRIQSAIRELLNGGGAGRVGKITNKTKTVTSSGDPRHLETALNASRQIRDLIGVDAPTVKRIELVTNDDRNLSVEDLRNMDPAELTRLISFALEGSQAA